MLNIKSTRHLALRLNYPEEKIISISEHIEQHCRINEIKTKKGKTRKAVLTSRHLATLQKKILNTLLYTIPVHEAAHGAVPTRSHKTNASAHCGHRAVATLDLKSCFPNIHSSRVNKLFQKLGCSPKIASILTKLTTFNYQLAQGFSTSSYLLNLILFPLDCNIQKYIAPKKLTYTRYIDDIAISGEHITEATFKTIIKL